MPLPLAPQTDFHAESPLRVIRFLLSGTVLGEMEDTLLSLRRER